MKPTRRELVHRLLKSRAGEWINAPEIASPEVGGSEGLRRLRELRADGIPVEMRLHPKQGRRVRQYRIPAQPLPSKVVPITFVRAHYRQKPGEEEPMPENLSWAPFNPAFGPWYRLQSSYRGTSAPLSSQGRLVEVVVIPDFDKKRFYWKVHFHALKPKSSYKKPLPEKILTGMAETLPQAQFIAKTQFEELHKRFTEAGKS